MTEPREPSNASSDPATPRVGDTISASRAGRIDPDVGSTQGGTRSHERASFSDPITLASGEDAPADQRVAGSAPITPAFEEPRGSDNPIDQGGLKGRATGRMQNGFPAPEHGTGTPVERADGDGLSGERTGRRE